MFLSFFFFSSLGQTERSSNNQLSHQTETEASEAAASNQINESNVGVNDHSSSATEPFSEKDSNETTNSTTTSNSNDTLCDISLAINDSN